MRLFIAISCLFILSACGHAPQQSSQESSQNQQPSRYSVDKDFSPQMTMDPATIKDAIPREDPITLAGNKNPYTVLGETYYLLPAPQGYKEQGGASWYGLKFHGHQTSNGEVYSIYGMTAAHKTLPIPSYVKVTNIANNRSVIVRINDRGPFHKGRIIDLSYAAATKLGYINEGTAQVIVEAIDPKTWKPTAEYQNKAGIYLQVGAYTMNKVAEEVYQTLFAKYDFPVQVESGKDAYHRVKIGPVEEDRITQITRNLQAEGFPEPIRLK